MEPGQATNPKPFQFSLRTLLFIVTLCVVGMAIVKSLGVNLLLEFSGLALSGCFIFGLALALVHFDRVASRLPLWTTFILIPGLYGVLTFAFYIFGEAIDQPHPEYMEGNWLSRGAAAAGGVCVFIGIVVFGITAIDAAVQKGRPQDRAYYPRLTNLQSGLALLHVRLILIFGGALILVYYGITVVEVFASAQRPSGWQWPPKRVFLTCQMIWGLLWLADCAARPRHGTMAAAIGYLVITTLATPVIGFGVMRE
jgi:hypothetical protein